MKPSTVDAPSQSFLWANRNFALLWSGQAISSIGNTLFDMTVILWIAAQLFRQETWAPLAVSGLLIATMLPELLIGPLAGVFVDRWDKRRTMLCADLLRALLILSLLLVTGILPFPFLAHMFLSPQTRLITLYSVVFLASVCAQFFGPARLVFLGDLIEERQQAQAAGLEQVTQSIATIVGPALAAPLLFGLGIQYALLFNAFSFAVSFLAIAAIHTPVSTQTASSEQPGNIGKEFLQGVSYTLKHHTIRALLIGVFLTTLGAGSINALSVFFFTQNLHAPLILIGLMDAVFGGGIIVGALVIGALGQRIGLERVFSSGILVIGVIFVILARMTNFGFVLGLMVFTGICQGAISVVSGPLILQSTPRQLIGRVVSVLNPSATFASLMSVALAGYLASTVLQNFHKVILGIKVGPIDTIYTAAGILIISGGLYIIYNGPRNSDKKNTLE